MAAPPPAIRRPRFRIFPRPDEWRAVAKRWGIAAGVVAVFCLLVWFFLLRMPGESWTGPLPPLDAAQTTVRGELESAVRRLAVEIGERNTAWPARLEAAARYVEGELAVCGPPRRVGYKLAEKSCDNVEVEIAGATRPAEIVVVGAHYDSVRGTAGANDNATGAAGVLALARRFAGTRPARTLRFVLFVNEEPPWFQTELMGSLCYARTCRERGDAVAAMLCLETLGCYRDEAGSQKYPAPGLSLAYPTTGDFVTFVGNVASRHLTREIVGEFRRTATIPSEGAALPAGIPGVGWSDQWSFWEQGWPAVMVTDTAPFRYPHYHTAQDTIERIDFDRFARVVAGLVPVVDRLANPR